MRTFRRTIVLLVVVLVVAGAVLVKTGVAGRWWQGQTGATTSGSATVVSVADGDTLTVKDGGQTVKIRLLGIDAPEISHGATPAGCGGPEARDALVAMLPRGTAVSYVTDPIADQIDQYGRVLAYVATDEIADVALALLDQGRAEAWVPAGEPHPTRWNAYTAAQRNAQRAKVGSWATCAALGR